MSIYRAESVISKDARIGRNVRSGPFCVIGPNVILEDDVELKSHVVIEGHTTIGKGTVVFPFASIGHPPQDLKYEGEPSSLVIGQNNVIREHVTIQPGTKAGRNQTRIGDACLFMVGAHVAHDCVVGNNVILANNATLAGHVCVEDHAIIGGLSAVHQNVRIGTHAIIGGMSGVEKDVVPYGLVKGERASLHGVNIIGLKRHGFSNDDIRLIIKVFDSLFEKTGSDSFSRRIESVRETHRNNAYIATILAFIEDAKSRSLCIPA